MIYYKKIFIALLFLSIVSCGKNDKNSEAPTVNTEQKTEQETAIKPDLQERDSIYESVSDSIRATKESVLRKSNYKRKSTAKINTDGKVIETTETSTTPGKPQPQKTTIPSFVYLKKILKKCKTGVPMTQKELQTNFDIPEEAIRIVKSVTKISDNELDIKWKSTWLVEKMSDAKFKDGRLKVRFDKNKMYTSGNAIGIKHEKTTYTDLILIGRSAYIPTVKGFYWEIKT
jgi:hypothetical protein